MKELDNLWIYQQKELELEKLELDIRASETRQKLLKLRNFLVKQQSDLDDFAAEVEQKSSKIEELLLSYEENEQKLSSLDFSDDESDLSKVREIKAQVLAIQAGLIKIRREIMDIIGYVEKIEEGIKNMSVLAGKARKEYTALKEVYDKESKEAAEDVENIKVELKTMSKDIDESLLKKYNGIKKNKSDPVAIIVSNQCGGCNMELPSLTLKKLKASDKLIECENCGRVLYYNQE